MSRKRRKRDSSLHSRGKQVKRRPNPVYRSFTSMRVGVALLLILIAACVLGTVVPQGADSALSTSPVGRVLVRLGLTHVFSSWWLGVIAALLGLSLAMCSWRRFQALIRPSRRGVKVHEADVSAMRRHAYFSSQRPRFEVADHLADWLARRGYRVIRDSSHHADGSPSSTFLLARKGLLGQWGALLLHVGLLVIIAGATYGHMPTIVVGSTTLWQRRSFDCSLELREGEPKRVTGIPGVEDFHIQLTKAHQRLSHRGMPEYFASDVVLSRGKRRIAGGRILMNRPFRYEGVSATMSSYAGPPLRTSVLIDPPGSGHQVAEIPVGRTRDGHLAVDMMGSMTEVQPQGWIVFSHHILPAAATRDGRVLIGPSGRPMAPDPKHSLAYAVSLFVAEDPREMRRWTRVGYLDTAHDEAYKGVRFRLLTGAVISLRRDPGIPVVYVGFALLTVGVMLALYVTQRTVRVRMTDADGQTQILAGVRSRGGISWTEDELDRLGDAVRAADLSSLPPESVPPTSHGDQAEGH